jgi:hypothetical protein
MARVLGVRAVSILRSSGFNVSGRISPNTVTAPRNAKALAVETKGVRRRGVKHADRQAEAQPNPTCKRWVM